MSWTCRFMYIIRVILTTIIILLLLTSGGYSFDRAEGTFSETMSAFFQTEGELESIETILRADLNGDGQEEVILVRKDGGTSSLLSYQVWHRDPEGWVLWLERDDLYRGTVEASGQKIIEKTPLYEEFKANAFPDSYREAIFTFNIEGEYSFEETERSVDSQAESTPMGTWQNPPRQEIEDMLVEAALLKGIPPQILQAIAYTESNLRQFHNGEPLLSFDGLSWGIMQVTPRSDDPEYLEKLKYDIEFNIQEGASILLEKWGYAFSSSPVIPKIGTGDPRIFENWYFAIWAYNGWHQSNNPNMIPYDFGSWVKTQAYQDKVLDFALSQFGQQITAVPPEQLPETGCPLPSTSFPTPVPFHHADYRVHHSGEILINVAGSGLVLRNDSWQRIATLSPGTGMEVLEGPVLHNGYIRYKVETLYKGDEQDIGWIALNWANPMGCCDINGDGQVDIYDLVRISRKLGLSGTGLEEVKRADLNFDGQVDLYDLFLANQVFTRDLVLPSSGGRPVVYEMSHETLRPGEIFTVDIVYNGSLEDFYGFELHLFYDAGKADLLEVLDLDPLGGSGSHVKTLLDLQEPGRVSLAETLVFEEGGLSGEDWTFLRLEYQALEEIHADSFILEKSQIKLSDSQGIPLGLTMGDVNGDGSIDVADAILILRHIVGLVELNHTQLTAANVGGQTDGQGAPLVDVSDAILILRYIVGLNELDG